jgi:hypothetical protein
LKKFKRFCKNCKKVFYCNNKCGSATALGEDVCFCKWCVEKLNAKKITKSNYNSVVYKCEHTKRLCDEEPEKVEFT